MASVNTNSVLIINPTSVKLTGDYSVYPPTPNEVCPFNFGFFYRVKGAAVWGWTTAGTFADCASTTQLNYVPFEAIIATTAATAYEVMAGTREASGAGTTLTSGHIVPFTTPGSACDLGIGDVGTVPVSTQGGSDGAISASISSSVAWQSRLIPGSTSYTPNKTNYTGLAAGTYTLEANDANGCTSTRTIEVGTAAAPPTEPPAPAGPSQFKPVGGVLDNPIWVSATVVPTANDGQPKKNHFVEFEIFNQLGTSIGKARGRVRNGTATADISTFLRGALKCRPDYNMLGTVAGDANAFVAYYVVSRESYGGFFQPDKLLTDTRTVAVNAATKDLAGHLAPYVVVN